MNSPNKTGRHEARFFLRVSLMFKKDSAIPSQLDFKVLERGGTITQSHPGDNLCDIDRTYKILQQQWLLVEREADSS
jgi:hypothetical protein